MNIYSSTSKNYKLFKKEYKTFFKQIENITLRCYCCQNIPEFIINFENDNITVKCAHQELPIDIISYIKLILDTHLCQMCLSKNDLYFSIENGALICCGNCREKFRGSIIRSCRRWERIFPRGTRVSRKDYQQQFMMEQMMQQEKILGFISYDVIDKNCIDHFKNYQYEDNLCEDCLLEKNISYSIKKIIEIKNFILSEKEIENLKNDINYKFFSCCIFCSIINCC